MTLWCAICLRKIPKKDVTEKRYTRSAHTGATFCLDFARHDQIQAKRRKAAA